MRKATLPYDENKLSAVTDWLGRGSINIFGPPLAGKDTQAHKLADALDAEVISGGAILRSHTISQEAKEMIDKGMLAPSRDYLNLITQHLHETKPLERPLVLSSLGRWHGEEESILDATREAGHPIKAVIYLQLDEATVWSRFRSLEEKNDRGVRADDTEKSLTRRIEEFRSKTLPVLDFYRKKDLIIKIDSDRSIENIAVDILDSLHQKSSTD